MIWLGGLALSVLGFLFGRVFAQSEAVLSEKRRVYEAFLRACPKPNDAYGNGVLNSEQLEPMHETYGPLMLYATPSVALAVARYLDLFGKVDAQLSPEHEALHPLYRELAKAHNDIILEMKRDVLSWSVYAYRGKSRLPSDAFEQARKKTL